MTLAPALPADLSLDALDDEDPAFAAALRAMLWDTYLAAGRPLGDTEASMLAWWAFGQGTTVQ